MLDDALGYAKPEADQAWKRGVSFLLMLGQRAVAECTVNSVHPILEPSFADASCAMQHGQPRRSCILRKQAGETGMSSG
jgi:hypothetical protein